MRAGVACLVAGLVGLAAFALLTQHRVVEEAKRSDAANRLATVYQDARFWVGQDESLERKYRVEPSRKTLALHEQSGDNLTADLSRVAALEGTAAARSWVARLLVRHREYEAATQRMFAATRAGDTRLAMRLDRTITDPIFGAIQAAVFDAATLATRKALNESAALRRDEASAFDAGLIAIVLAVCLAAAMRVMVRRLGRAGSSMRAAEVRRKSLTAVTDSLTSLRNHRGFYEDLGHALLRVSRTGEPLALVLLDVDGLGKVNNTYGHQAGDDQLSALAHALTSALGADDRAYRVGDDEFAVLLPSAGEWAGFQFARRLGVALERVGAYVHATAGVAQARAARGRDDLIRDAGLALVNAKGSGQAAAVYTPDMGLSPDTPEQDGKYVRTLANSLALAVDAKDSCTESHSQTVANLCASIGNELGFEAERLRRLRLAGLLHDVGKIGIPDAILRKPAKLTPAEYELMKTHAALGADIVIAAEMPERAGWIRHHHERIDGRGYPDGLAGGEIPLESRVIQVADAFEAMTSDRPYRKAPGQRFAIEELRRNSGTQFDAGVVDAFLRVLGERSASDRLRPAPALDAALA